MKIVEYMVWNTEMSGVEGQRWTGNIDYARELAARFVTDGANPSSIEILPIGEAIQIKVHKKDITADDIELIGGDQDGKNI